MTTRQGICAPLGFQANGVHCGIRRNKSKKDLCLIYSDVLCNAASCYTQNKIKGAPIGVTQLHLQNGHAQAIIVNSGNANTCNSNGVEIATQMCELASDVLHINKEDVIVASTGVIGEQLYIEPIVNHIQELRDGLCIENSLAACEAIMTTDTFPKQFNSSFQIGDVTCTLGAIAKGSGMIHPNMATLLGFVTCDVAISTAMLQQVLTEVVNDTFNMVSVDGDTSTNDMLSIMCNGLAKNDIIDCVDDNYKAFKSALFNICMQLSKDIARDGEGATKLLTCHVKNAQDIHAAKKVAKAVISSSLVKSAMFGCDANWGRILCALGYSEANYNVDSIDVVFQSNKGKLDVCKDSKGVSFDEVKALEILKEKEVEILIDLKDGSSSATAWGCDLTYDYVKINGDYRT